jgi:hypothetical protein
MISDFIKLKTDYWSPTISLPPGADIQTPLRACLVKLKLSMDDLRPE